MKAKIFSLMTLSILSLILLAGLTAAASLSHANVVSPAAVQQGDGSFKITFDLINSGLADDIDWSSSTATQTTAGATFSFSHNTIGDGSVTPITISVTATVTFNELYSGILSGNIVATPLALGGPETIPFSVQILETPRPTEIDECLAIGDSGNLMDLEIEEISVIAGFGDEDTEWVPLDTIEVEVLVENNDKDYDLEDVEVSWGLYNLNTQEWIFDEEESDFKLKDGDETTLVFEFKLEDPDEFENNDDYVFYVWTNAIGEELDNEVCKVVSEDIDVIVENDFLILDNFEVEGTEVEDEFYYEMLSCGGTYQITADLWNIGDSDQEDIEIRIHNSDFEIDETLDIGDIDAFDSESISFEFTIPEGMEEDVWHSLEFIIEEDGDVFENDYVDEDAEFKVLFKLENCAVPQAFVGASLDSDAKAGKELVVRTTITNTGTETTNYLINAYGYSEWASSASVEPTTITLKEGQSADVLITLDVKRDVSGERLFNIEVLSEGELVMSQPLSVNIEKALIGDIFSDNGLLTALIIGIAIVLIIIIIVLAVRLARK